MFRRLNPYQLSLDVALAVLFGLVALWAELGYGWGSAVEPLASTATCVLMAGALAMRRLSPALALGLAWFGAIVQMSFGRPPMVADIAIFAVLYATAAYGSRTVFWAGLASSLLGAVVITGYLFLIPELAGGGLSRSTLPLAVVVLVAAAFALGLSWTLGALVRTAVRARENRRAQQLAEAEAVAEQERVRIARDMHDVVAHSLAVVIAQADGARYAAASDPAATTAALGTISTTARSALADVRLLLTQLRHSQGDGPQPTLADLEELYAQVRAAGAELRVDVDPAPSGEPPAAAQLAVYRILQEALTNALRHGDGGPVDVRLAWHPSRVDLEVRNGVTGSVPGTPGHGLIGMRERAQLAGGRLDAVAEGDRFVVSASLPIGGVA
ncbi:histidine kinase [Microbacterium thalassium]|uniref:histidine kinase n=1 Tax=Microbacterium TaxID=33882 RepID=UPI00146C6772|nr:histidine kinase [Microbacterium thalassium]